MSVRELLVPRILDGMEQLLSLGVVLTLAYFAFILMRVRGDRLGRVGLACGLLGVFLFLTRYLLDYIGLVFSMTSGSSTIWTIFAGVATGLQILGAASFLVLAIVIAKHASKMRGKAR